MTERPPREEYLRRLNSPRPNERNAAVTRIRLLVPRLRWNPHGPEALPRVRRFARREPREMCVPRQSLERDCGFVTGSMSPLLARRQFLPQLVARHAESGVVRTGEDAAHLLPVVGADDRAAKVAGRGR